RNRGRIEASCELPAGDAFQHESCEIAGASVELGACGGGLPLHVLALTRERRRGLALRVSDQRALLLVDGGALALELGGESATNLVNASIVVGAGYFRFVLEPGGVDPLAFGALFALAEDVRNRLEEQLFECHPQHEERNDLN